MLRAYMHGFFVDNRLYEKAKILTDPFAYETYRQERIQKKLEEERQSRISLARKLPKVNAKVAAKLMAQERADADDVKGEGEGGASKRKGEASVNPLSDNRFKAMFEENDFAIDEESAEFKLLHHRTAGSEALLARVADFVLTCVGNASIKTAFSEVTADCPLIEQVTVTA